MTAADHANTVREAILGNTGNIGNQGNAALAALDALQAQAAHGATADVWLHRAHDAKQRAKAAEAERDRLQTAVNDALIVFVDTKWGRKYATMYATEGATAQTFAELTAERDRLADALRDIAWGRGTHAQDVIVARAALAQTEHTQQEGNS